MSGGGAPKEAQAAAFVFLSLLIGAIFRELYRRLHVPFTPSLMIFGILIGTLSDSMGDIGHWIQTFTDIDPHGIIILFIPILLFESAMNANWYVFRKSFLNIFILAGPGVVFNIAFTGTVIKLLYPGEGDQGFTWFGAFTLSAIISTTDPVAVVALLKEVGAPPHFNTLVEGESLLNDGSAIVFFNLFLGMMNGNQASVESIALDLFIFAGLGPLIGIAFGIIGSYWLRRILRDEILVTCLTFVMCILCFYTVEYIIGSSGILAVVACGLFMAVFGKTKIDHQAEHSLHSVWGFFQWNCETIIFLLAGIIIGVHQMESNTVIDLSDWLKMIGLYVGITVGRGCMIFLFFPILRKNGYGLNWREALVLTYGGLRGAISLALALAIPSVADGGGVPNRTKELMVFHAAGMATLTMVINATTAGWVIKKLKAIKVSSAKSKIKLNLLAEMQVKANHKLSDLQKQKYYELCDWSQTKALVGLSEEDSALFTQQILNQTEKALTVEYDHRSEIRFRILKLLQKMFWESFEEGQLSAKSIMLLSQACDSGIDKISRPLHVWDNIYSHVIRFRGIRVMQFLMKCPLLRIPARKYIARYISLLYQVTTTFILVAEDIIDNQEEGIHNKKHFKVVIGELQKQLLEANNYLVSIQDSFADTIKAIQVRRAAFHIIHYQIHLLDHALEDGQIDKNEYNEIRLQLDKKILKLDKVEAHSVWSVPTFDDFVVQFPVFSMLTKEQSTLLRDSAVTKVFNKNDMLFTQGYKATDLFVIVKGVVKEYYDSDRDHGYNKGVGSILSFSHAVEKHCIPLSNCVALGYVELRRIPIDLVRTIMKENKKFEEQCYNHALINFVRSPHSNCKELSTLDDRRIHEYAEGAKIVKISAGQAVEIEKGAILFEGCLTRKVNAVGGDIDEITGLPKTRRFTTLKHTQATFEAVSYIPKSVDLFEASEDTVLMVFRSDLKAFIEECNRTVHDNLKEEDEHESHGDHMDHHQHHVHRKSRTRSTNLLQTIVHEKAVDKAYQDTFGKKPVKIVVQDVRDSVDERGTLSQDDSKEDLSQKLLPDSPNKNISL